MRKRYTPKRLMTGNQDKYYSCQRKVAYETRAEAEAAIKELHKKRRGGGLETYPCRYGPHFHYGHFNKQRRTE